MYTNFCKVIFAFFFILFFIPDSYGQKKSKIDSEEHLKTTPKLVVGIVVDQMRYDYLTRFWNQFEEGGFKRLVNDGFNCKNNHYNYAPTSTGPGHASIYTGTTPATHGIIGNNWYDKITNADVYCAEDSGYNSVGTATDSGKMAPTRLTVTTITDQLRLHTQMRGKTIAVALKDRGAILPGGHTANAAYWFHGADEGNWISSTYYMSELPKWVTSFNASNTAETYKKTWNTSKVINSYMESGSDNNAYEGLFDTETAPIFPHSPASLLSKSKDYDIIKITPFGNSLTADFALAALDGEKLGKDEVTDFLAISFSSTDYVGHMFGVNSKEIEDTYIQLDADIARILSALDKKVGKNNYTIFLTADHGAINVPAYLNDQKIPAGYVDFSAVKSKFAEFLKYKFGTEEIVKNFSNYQVFLDHKVIQNLDIDLSQAQKIIARELLSYDAFDHAYTADQMWQNNYTEGIPYILQKGYNQKRSGDVLLVLKPGFITYSKTGSTHGSPQIYDTHVPLLFYGKGIKPGSTFERTEIPDVAPTIAALLGIAFPNGTTGSPITKVLE